MEESHHNKVNLLVRTITVFFSGAGAVLVVCFFLNRKPLVPDEINDVVDLTYGPSSVYRMNYDTHTLGDSEKELEIKLGYEIFSDTPKYLPVSEDSLSGYVGNVLSCNNCHLLGGTKAYASPLIGITKRFPQFRPRENKIGTIEERINGCMERSMNGKVMHDNQKEMLALVAYLHWISRYAPHDGQIEGMGFLSIEIPNRAVDLNHGEDVFRNNCVECHGANGGGRPNSNGEGFLYPPLWGPGSYNNGAGMTRVITAAQFIKANMPYGTVYHSPKLTDEEAYDVAGFINQQTRPIKPNLQLDFPDLLKKPISTPYPPYTDSFSLEQHQLGPFQPIMDYYLKEHGIKKTK